MSLPAVSKAALALLTGALALGSGALPERHQLMTPSADEPQSPRLRLSGAAAVEFLRAAAADEVEEPQGGINTIWRIRMSWGGIVRRAVFRTVLRHEMVDGWHFPDSYLSEVAAYELSRFLELPYVPATITTEIEGRAGALQLWVENAMTEAERRERGLEPPASALLRQQRDVMNVFDNLIGNTDRHDRNVLFDEDWNLWLIDHTRSFSRNAVLASPEPARRCPRGLWLRLQSVGERSVVELLDAYLGEAEIEALLGRWELVLGELRQQIDRLGEEQVIFP